MIHYLLADSDSSRRAQFRSWLANPPSESPDFVEATSSEELEHKLADGPYDVVVAVASLSARGPRGVLDLVESAEERIPLLLLTDGDPPDLPLRPKDDVIDLHALTPPLLARAAVRLADRRVYDRTLMEERASRVRAEEALAQLSRTDGPTGGLLAERMATLSHDLRSPLNALIGYSELIREELEERGETELLPDIERIHDVSRKMLGIVTNLTDIETVEDVGDLSNPNEAEALNALFKQAGQSEQDEEPDERLILIIDDDDDLRELMARFLQSEGFRVETASNGEEGLRMARELKPAVVTLDVRMPGIDGWDVLSTLKSEKELRETPVIMLTGRGNERIAARALRQGVDDYLIKGDISALGLRRAVEGVLEKTALKRAVEEARRSLIKVNENLEVQVDQQTEQIRSLASSLTLAEQEERHRIARILHDNLQQHLTALIIRVKLLSQKPPEDALPILGKQLDDITRLLKEALQMTRTLTVELSPPVLQESSLTTTMEWLAHYIEDLHGLEVEVEASHSCSVPRQEMRLLLFQLVRELLFNVVKHAGTEHAAVKIEQDDAELMIQVIDEGAGFDLENYSPTKRTLGGWGLNTMGERLSLFKGRLDIDSEPGKGTRTTITVPCNMLELPAD